MIENISKDVIFDFTDKNFVVTGASSGIGKQIVIELAEANANILAIARREDVLKKLATKYPNITVGALDVRDYDEMEKQIKNFVDSKGKLSGTVHVAGLLSATTLKFYDETIAKDIMDVSFWAGVKLIQIATKVKYSVQGSSNVLFASTAASKKMPGFFAYSSSKAAIKSGIHTIADEISSKKHRINTISPGYVITEMTDKSNLETNERVTLEKHQLLGFGKPTDISGVVLFLLSSRASWITGTDVVVDGGFLA